MSLPPFNDSSTSAVLHIFQREKRIGKKSLNKEWRLKCGARIWQEDEFEMNPK